MVWNRTTQALKNRGPGPVMATVRKPEENKSFTVRHRRRVMVRTFTWMSRCRRQAKDFERIPAGSPAWAQPAACRFPMHRVARG